MTRMIYLEDNNSRCDVLPSQRGINSRFITVHKKSIISTVCGVFTKILCDIFKKVICPFVHLFYPARLALIVPRIYVSK